LKNASEKIRAEFQSLPPGGKRRGYPLLQLPVSSGLELRSLDPFEPQISRGCADADRFLPAMHSEKKGNTKTVRMNTPVKEN
jgi:hypothetical protein